MIPAVVALMVTIGMILFIPALSSRYMLEVIDTELAEPDYYKYYYDLNGDGTSEVIFIYLNSSGNLAVSVANSNLNTFNQFNLPGQLTTLGEVLDLQDVNADGVQDLILCTVKRDSLYLTIIDDLYSHPTFARHFFIERVNQFNDNGDLLFSKGKLTDLNRDGSPEYVFGINGGHALQPRCIYAVDYRNDSVFRSPLSGAAVTGFDAWDLDKDGAEEILLSTVAPENFKTPFPYNDSVSWLMVLDESLQFYKPPLMLNVSPSWVNLVPFQQEGKNFIMSYHRYWGTKHHSSVISIYDDSIRLLKSRYFHDPERTPVQVWREPGGGELGNIKVLMGNGIYTVDFDIHFVDSVINESPFGYATQHPLDLDQDGESEYVTFSWNRIVIFRKDLTESAGVDFYLNERNPKFLISAIEQGNAHPILNVQAGREISRMKYYRNPWFRYRKVVYPGLFMIIFGLLYLVSLLQGKLIRRRYDRDRLLNKLQLQAIKNQLDPHFTFNALNAVGSLIYKEEKDLAYQYLKGLTDLLRMVSGDASDVTWLLSDELEFVRKYLEIEKLRFREKFNYRIEVGEERFYGFQIPKMSILTFVENAIKHGLKHRQDDRHLEITVYREGNGLKISIKDNGIGRTAAAKYADESTGNGIELMRLYFKQFGEATRKKAFFTITDLFEYDLKAAGTLVEIFIQ